MVSPALQLSVKMPENRLQVWAASLLAGTSPSPHPSPSAYPSLLVWVVSGFLSSADLYHTLGEGDKERALRQQSDSVLEQLEQGGNYFGIECTSGQCLPHTLCRGAEGSEQQTPSADAGEGFSLSPGSSLIPHLSL